MNEQELIKEICQKEILYGCYEAKIKGCSIYSIIRRRVREKVLRMNGIQVMQTKTRINRKEAIKSVVISAYHLIKLLVTTHKRETIFLSFPRIDNINGFYLDKFTDPIIELCDLSDNYIIFEHGLGGVHRRNRLHHNNLVYIDVIYPLSKLLSQLFGRIIYLKHKKEFEKLDKSLAEGFRLTDNISLYKEYFMSLASSRIYSILFRRLSAKRVVGPSRDYLKRTMMSARRQNIKVFEMQHGITYGETIMYSGYRDEMFLPNYFLAFGDNKPLNVYGIDEKRIVNIGWALQTYIQGIEIHEHYNKNDVLVISDPVITDAIFNVIIQLAKDNADITFFIRPHPHEVITDYHLGLIKDMNNICIQDKSINISVVLQGFDNVIGENSTVLYEALAIGKKVGKLFFEGLNPKYLEESDRDCFWEIKCPQDFDAFIAGDNSTKKSKCIYSKFNKDLFLKTIGLK